MRQLLLSSLSYTIFETDYDDNRVLWWYLSVRVVNCQLVIFCCFDFVKKPPPSCLIFSEPPWSQMREYIGWFLISTGLILTSWKGAPLHVEGGNAGFNLISEGACSRLFWKGQGCHTGHRLFLTITYWLCKDGWLDSCLWTQTPLLI